MITKFGFEGSAEPLQQYNASLGKSVTLLAGMAAALGTAAAGMRKFTTDTLKADDALVEMSTHTDTGIQNIREWGFIADQTQSSSATLESSIQSLSQQISQAAWEGSENFSRLGISIRDSNGEIRNAGQVFMEVRDRFSEMNLEQAEMQHLAESIGLDRSLVQMLKLSNEEFSSLAAQARQYGEIQSEHKDTILEYNNAQQAMAYGMDSLKTLVAVGLAPSMQGLSEMMSELIKDHKDLVVEGVQVLAEALSSILSALVRLRWLIPVIIALFVTWKIATIGLGAVLSVVFSPLYLYTAAVVALLLVVDDLIVAFKGGKSVIGAFFDEFFNVDLEKVGEALGGTIYEIVQGGIPGAIDNIKESISMLVDWIGDGLSPVWDAAVEGAENIFEKMKQPFIDLFKWIEEKINQVAGLFSGIGDFFNFGDESPDSEEQTRSSMRSSLSPGDVPLAGFASQGGQQVNQTNYVTVQSPDAEGAGRSVDRNLQRQLRDANQHLRRGGSQ